MIPLGVTILPFKFCVASFPIYTVVNISTGVLSSSANVSSLGGLAVTAYVAHNAADRLGCLPFASRTRTALAR